ncbi:MAG: hypothetical protein MI861_23950, partial [Pirellulales bacterium]|nr:hypothetical protein [Pirellulales bacterium]
THRLAQLEHQLERLTDLLAEQTVTRRRRRRKLTIRLVLLTVVGFACLFAWFGNVFHHSRRQAAAVDRLLGQNTFVMYSPRESSLVSLLPGDTTQPPPLLVRWLGDDFFRAATNVSTAAPSNVKRKKEEVVEALSDLPELQRLRLKNLQLKTADLMVLGKSYELQSLDVARTGLDSGGMPWIRDKPLRWFNGSHTRLSDRAMGDLSYCKDLQQLYLERTAVTDAGLKHLYGMSQLRYINLKRSPVSAQAVKQLSDALPGCVIEWEPLRFLPGGQVDTRAAARGRTRYGQMMQQDPRLSRRAVPPSDQAQPQPVLLGSGNLRTWTFQNSKSNPYPELLFVN